MNKPLVSIIIPTYNRADLIGETLDSVLAQTYQNWECIIVDDGSTDNSKHVIGEYLEKDGRFQYHNRPLERPKGANTCRNYGFKVSKGEYVIYLDSDDVLDVFCISERVALVISDLDVDLLIRDSSKLIGNKIINETINRDPENIIVEEYLKMFLRYEIPWQTMGAFYKREILNSVQFDEKLQRFQDVSFNIKVLSQFECLNLLRDFKIDSSFRIDEKKLQREGHIEQMFKSLVIFNKIHRNLLLKAEYRKNLQLFNYHFFEKYIILFFDQSKEASNFVLLNSVSLKMFTFKQNLSIIGLYIYLNTGLYFKEGYGANRFRKFFNNSFLNY
ncbi:glycosyltransferase family 2 protein [Flavobacterium flavipallidum]|uniref:Glycosyltransferase family 2 protein n=1 Tax=Flavobacterium flavipallidum TaxID=3139140 RepID=A0ABU9HK40_9FLAO